MTGSEWILLLLLALPCVAAAALTEYFILYATIIEYGVIAGCYSLDCIVGD